MFRFRSWSALVFLLAVVPAQAATVAKVSDEALNPLRFAPRGAHVRIDALPLYDSKRSAIDVEEFAVWSAGGKVLVHNDDGTVPMDPPPARYFRGLVNGDPESFAFFAVDQKTQRVDGLIVTKDGKFSLAANRRPKSDRMAHRDTDPEADVDYFLTRFDDSDEQADGSPVTWECKLDKEPRQAPFRSNVKATNVSGSIPVAQSISGSQSYALSLEVETDFDLYTNSGSSTANLTTYVTNLTGALATVYKRDLNTDVRLKTLNIYTTNGADPWTATDSNTGLDEVGDKYHNASIKPNGRTTSAVVMLSGVSYGGGIAWEGVIGGSDFFQSGHWGGPYSWCGGIGNLGTFGLGAIPDVNTSPYNMPSGTQNYWPLVEYAHELGHNLGGHHTHCVAITDAERTAAGFTDGSPNTSASNFVDHCYGAEGAGCFSGGTYVAGSAGTFKGTIMSYCHNVRVSNVPQSRFTFGPAGEPSHHELDDYMLRASGPLASFSNIVSSNAITITGITKPASVVASSTGNAASVAVTPGTGATYFWEITNGTITAGQNTNAITFTAGTTGSVTLKVTAYSSNLTGVTDSVSIPITASCTFGLAQSAATFFSAATTGSVTVTATCAWTAVSNNAFITVTGGASGTGNGTVSYSLSANITGSQRSGTITIAGLTYTITQKSIAPKRGDFNFDGEPDLIWRNPATGEIVIYYMSGGHAIGAVSVGNRGTDWAVVGAADFNADGVSDLVWRNQTTGADSMWVMNGATMLRDVALPASTPNWYIEALGDFTGDGQPDIVWHDHTSGIGTIWRMVGTVAASGTQIQGAVLPWHIAAANDFNNDGQTDLMWRNLGDGQNSFWRMNGTTVVTGVEFDRVADTNWRIIANADFNADGKPDIVWRNITTGANEIWYISNFAFAGATTTDSVTAAWDGVGPR